MPEYNPWMEYEIPWKYVIISSLIFASGLFILTLLNLKQLIVLLKPILEEYQVTPNLELYLPHIIRFLFVLLIFGIIVFLVYIYQKKADKPELFEQRKKEYYKKMEELKERGINVEKMEKLKINPRAGDLAAIPILANSLEFYAKEDLQVNMGKVLISVFLFFLAVISPVVLIKLFFFIGDKFGPPMAILFFAIVLIALLFLGKSKIMNRIEKKYLGLGAYDAYYKKQS